MASIDQSQVSIHLPLPAAPLLRHLAVQISWLQLKKSTHCRFTWNSFINFEPFRDIQNLITLSPICLVQPCRLSWFLGKPSIRKLFFSLWVIARSSREQVISTGTMVPLVMWCSISSPNWKEMMMIIIMMLKKMTVITEMRMVIKHWQELTSVTSELLWALRSCHWPTFWLCQELKNCKSSSFRLSDENLSRVFLQQVCLRSHNQVSLQSFWFYFVGQ